MKKARIIVRYGIGVDQIDLEAAAARGIPVCNCPDYCIDEVADHTLSFMLALTRQNNPSWEAVRAGAWKLAVPLAEMHALRDMTVGLAAGFGRIVREVAERLLSFKCRICVYDPVVESRRHQTGGVPTGGMERAAGRERSGLAPLSEHGQNPRDDRPRRPGADEEGRSVRQRIARHAGEDDPILISALKDGSTSPERRWM